MFGRKILTPQQVAKEMQVSLKTVYRWIYAGKLKASRIGEKTYRVYESDMDKFMAKTRVR